MGNVFTSGQGGGGAKVANATGTGVSFPTGGVVKIAGIGFEPKRVFITSEIGGNGVTSIYIDAVAGIAKYTYSPGGSSSIGNCAYEIDGDSITVTSAGGYAFCRPFTSNVIWTAVSE